MMKQIVFGADYDTVFFSIQKIERGDRMQKWCIEIMQPI